MEKRKKVTEAVPGFTPAPTTGPIDTGLPPRPSPLEECRSNVNFLMDRVNITEGELDGAKAALRREYTYHTLRAEEIRVTLSHMGVAV